MARTDPALWLANYRALFGKADEAIHRWNEGKPLGTPVVVTFRFAENYPSYSTHLNNPTAEFRAFPEELRAIARDTMHGVEDFTNITFVEDLSKPEDQIDLLISGTIYAGGAGNSPGLNFKYAGDIYIGIGDGVGLTGSGDDVVGDGSFAGFRETFIHELGHSLGLWHPRQYLGSDGIFNPTSDGYRVAIDLALENTLHTVMSYYGPAGATDNQWVRTFMPLDILALQNLYGTNEITTGGSDTYQFSALNPGVRTIWDAGGFDTMNLSNMTVGANVDLRIGGVSDIGMVSITSDWAPNFNALAKGNIVIGPETIIEAVIGSAFDDVIIGNDTDNILFGMAGNDSLMGGIGDDRFEGGAGADKIDGGAGSDVASYEASLASVVVDLSVGVGRGGDAENDVLTSIENVIGSDFADVLTGTGANNYLSGGLGDDILIGGEGSDRLDGGDGRDKAIYQTLFNFASIDRSLDGDLIVSAAEGRDTVTNVEFLQFTDGAFISDSDSVGAQISRLYDAVLQRQPDNNGFDFYLDQIEDRKVSILGVANDLIGSDEFQQATGQLTNAQFVDYIYRHTLGRAPDAGGKGYYTQHLDSGLSRGAMLVSFSESSEHRALTADEVGAGYFNTDDTYQSVALLYDGFAGRLPDAGGLTYYAEKVKSGALTLSQVANDFAGSAEFRAAISGKTNGQIVDYIYQNTLDRPAEAGGKAFYTSQLDSGATAAGVLLDVALSQEHYNLFASHIVYGIDVL